MIEAELHLAYAWDCDGCGRENFERAMVVDDDEEEADVLYPESVTCRHCGNIYSARPYTREETFERPDLPDGSEEETE